MALKNKVKFELLVDPDDPTVLILSPIGEELQDGSKYTINIKNVMFEDGTNYSEKEEFITTPNNYYFVSVSDVQDLIHGLKLDEENILHHIMDASRTAMYWAKRKMEDTKQMPDFNSPTFQEDYYPFYMYIKHTAIAHAIKEYYIEMITGPKKWKDTLSDLGREEEMDFDALRRLMDDLEHEADEWLELVVTITADPKWALRGKYSYAIYNTYSNPYHKISWYRSNYDNYGRGF